MFTMSIFSCLFDLTLAILLKAILVSSLSSSNEKLVLVNALYRHGDRTPVRAYPNDPYNNLSYWPDGWGQLTNIGKEQHYELGQWLRIRYGDFLPTTYYYDDIYVRSTDVERTLMSAAANLAGLYPPNGTRERWNKKINWQPIPIHTVPEKLDEHLAGERPCPRYDSELERVKSSPEMQKYNEKHAELYKYASENSGNNIHDVENLEYLYNTLFIENLYNLTLPNWTRDVFPQKMASVASFSFTIPAKTKLLQRLKIGPLVGDIVRHMKQKRNGILQPNYKMFMYSGHDITVANFLMALGAFDPQSPPYRSLVLVELWKNIQDEYYVKVFYRNTTTDVPYNITIPGCTTSCPLDKFAELLEDVIPTHWENECKMGIFSYIPYESLAFIALTVSGVLAMLLLLSMIFGIVHWKKQKSSAYYYHRITQDVN